MSVLVIGGGIAGFSIAHALLALGAGPVTLLERESLPFSHASGLNAAIFRPLESPIVSRLAQRSRALMAELSPELVKPVGLILTASTEQALTSLQMTADELALPYTLLTDQALWARAPLLSGGARYGLWLPEGGVIDIHCLTDVIRRSAIKSGLRVFFCRNVEHIEQHGQRLTAIVAGTSEHFSASRVVIAGGAWAAEVGARCGYPVPLVPHRRHLAQLAPSIEYPSGHPICWNVETNVYFRPESRGVLASPGDHTPHLAALPQVSQEQLARLGTQLALEAPALADSSVRRAWACLRTMSPDGHMLLGSDPRMPGLSWFAGLAGHGMSAGLAAAEALAQLLVNEVPLAPELDIQRYDLGRAGQPGNSNIRSTP